MTITKDQMARDLAEKTGYYLKDVKVLLSAMDDYVKEVFSEVTDDEGNPTEEVIETLPEPAKPAQVISLEEYRKKHA